MPVCHIYNTFGEELRKFDTADFGAFFTIGRSSRCDVSLKGMADDNVSREHLDIKKTGGNWNITSVGHSGMLVDGEKIMQTQLTPGLVIRFSQLFLCVGEKNGPSPYDLTWDADTENNQHRAVLWPGVNTIGASRDNYVTVRTDDVSRVHGKITVQSNGKIFYENLFTTRRAEVNGTTVGENASVEITPGDVLKLADTELNVIRGFRAPVGASMTGKVLAGHVKSVAKTPLGWIAAILLILLLATLIFTFIAHIIWQVLLG